MKTLITGGIIVGGSKSYEGSVLIDGEKISRVFEGKVPSGIEADDIVDARGKLLFPGFIDAHTHFDLHVAGTVQAVKPAHPAVPAGWVSRYEMLTISLRLRRMI